MKITRITQSLVAVFAAIFIAGCASTSGSKETRTKTASAERSGSQVHTTGMGEAGRFTGSDGDRSFEIAPGSDQIYYFAFNNFDPTPYVKAIHAQAVYLKQNQRARILLEGHTDERGSREYNVGLGERRAGSVQEVLLLAGVNPNQIRMVSYGEEKPAMVGSSESAHSKNRRVELIYEAK